MDFYNKIKNELINNEIYRKAKDYSKSKNDLTTYYNVGKLLSEAGKHYGESIIKKYSCKLINDIGKKYNERTLRRMRQFYILFDNEKWSAVPTKLTWSHYTELLTLKDKNKIEDFIKNPILIRRSYDYEEISEKLLKQLILEDLDSFLKELGDGFCYIENEYKIKLGNRYNYIDMLLFNYKYNCFTVVELKVTELKKEHIGQIQTYMNYINKNVKDINQDKTIGIIICKKNNEFVMEYCSDNRIFETTYIIN